MAGTVAAGAQGPGAAYHLLAMRPYRVVMAQAGIIAWLRRGPGSFAPFAPRRLIESRIRPQGDWPTPPLMAPFFP
jgi:hypothetical protein